jgi:hypothetical protein
MWSYSQSAPLHFNLLTQVLILIAIQTSLKNCQISVFFTHKSLSQGGEMERGKWKWHHILIVHKYNSVSFPIQKKNVYTPSPPSNCVDSTVLHSFLYHGTYCDQSQQLLGHSSFFHLLTNTLRFRNRPINFNASRTFSKPPSKSIVQYQSLLFTSRLRYPIHSPLMGVPSLIMQQEFATSHRLAELIELWLQHTLNAQAARSGRLRKGTKELDEAAHEIIWSYKKLGTESPTARFTDWYNYQTYTRFGRASAIAVQYLQSRVRVPTTREEAKEIAQFDGDVFIGHEGAGKAL